jgi:hypothetical protein
MKRRLIKEGLITTILGLIVIIFSGAMIYTGKASAGEMSGWLAFGIMFLRSKDSLIGLSKGEENI